MTHSSATPGETEKDFPLSDRQQTRNILLYAITNWLLYLCAPVVYVGITQASLCNALGTSDMVANLPSSAFFWGAVFPIVVVWRFHTVAAIKSVLVTCNLVIALAGLLVAALLYWPTPTGLRLSVVVLYGGLIGSALGVLNPFSWELISRGVAPRRRGTAFALAFGLGPLMAVAGSLSTQLVLSGSIEVPWLMPSGELGMVSVGIAPLQFPSNFAVVFAATFPILVLAALLSSQFVLPLSGEEPARPPFTAALLLAARELINDRVLRTAIMAYVLVDAACSVVNTMSLYTSEVLGSPAEDYAGYQNALRFGFKAMAGLFLGWFVRRTHAWNGMLATGGLALGGVLWVLLMPRAWFLISFGLMGAGELYGVYYPNYIMLRSRADRVRHNMAILQLFGLATSLAPSALGAISDAYGFTAAFVTAGLVVMTSLLLILFRLPINPRPPFL